MTSLFRKPSTWFVETRSIVSDKNKLPQILIAGVIVLALTACQPTTPSPSLPVSTWGSVITLAQAEQTNAPALYVNNNGMIAAWVGADEQGVFHRPFKTSTAFVSKMRCHSGATSVSQSSCA